MICRQVTCTEVLSGFDIKNDALEREQEAHGLKNRGNFEEARGLQRINGHTFEAVLCYLEALKQANQLKAAADYCT